MAYAALAEPAEVPSEAEQAAAAAAAAAAVVAAAGVASASMASDLDRALRVVREDNLYMPPGVRQAAADAVKAVWARFVGAVEAEVAAVKAVPLGQLQQQQAAAGAQGQPQQAGPSAVQEQRAADQPPAAKRAKH